MLKSVQHDVVLTETEQLPFREEAKCAGMTTGMIIGQRTGYSYRASRGICQTL